MYYQNSYYYLVPLTSEQIEEGLNQMRLNQSNYSNEYRKSENNLDKLYEPLTGLVYGNMFVNEYRGYKDYKPGIAKPNNEREQLMLDVMMYSNAAHDLALRLDIVPNDKELLKKFTEYNLKAHQAIRVYEEKYGPLQKTDAGDVNGEFSWVKVKSPWLER